MHNYRSDLIIDDTAVIKMNWLFMSSLFSVRISAYTSKIRKACMMLFPCKVISKALTTGTMLPLGDRFAAEKVSFADMP